MCRTVCVGRCVYRGRHVGIHGSVYSLVLVVAVLYGHSIVTDIE